MRSHRHVRVLEAEPRDPVREHVDDRVEQVLWRAMALERGIDLLGGLLDIAEVSDKHPRGTGTNKRDAIAARVAGQVADVREVRYQQRIDPRVRQQRYESVRALAHISSSWASRASASR